MIVKKWRFFAPWRESEQEQWLQEMSRAGLHLLDANYWGHHRFIPGPPQDFVYRWSILPSKECEYYKQLYLDAGWEIAAVSADFLSFICWRKPAAEGGTEVFTDVPAKRRQKLVHVLWLGGASVLFAIAAGAPHNTPLFTTWHVTSAAVLGYSALRLGWQAFTMGRKHEARSA